MKSKISLLSFCLMSLSPLSYADSRELPRLPTPDPGPYEARVIPGNIQRVSLASIKRSQTPRGVVNFIEVMAEYCGGGSEPVFALSGAPATVYGVNLDGYRSTYRRIGTTFTYTIYAYRNDAIADVCNPRTTTLKLKCEVVTGYGGAGCDFSINERQGIYVQVLGSQLPTVQLYQMN